MFIELTNTKGKKVLFGVGNIVYIDSREDKRTLIYSNDDSESPVAVEETYEQVKNTLSKAVPII